MPEAHAVVEIFLVVGDKAIDAEPCIRRDE